MIIRALLWDKKTSVTLSGQLFTAEFLRNHWNGETRVLIAYDDDISRVQPVTDTCFSADELDYMLGLMETGFSHEQAITATWEMKAIAEWEEGLISNEDAL